VTVIDKDKGWAAFGEAVHNLSDNPHVKVGVQGAEASSQHGADGLTNVELATYHEYGLGVPRRSFLRDAIDQHQRELANLLAVQGQRVLLGEITEAYALALVGEVTVGMIKERIIAHIHPPLEPPTIKAKGGKATPLIDYGHLLASITYKLGTEG
jgi:hypothetical protein